MPVYEYKCENGHIFEAVRKMADDPLTECEVCEAPVERVFHPFAVHFKGSGFYTTDYAKKKVDAGSSDSKSAEGSKSSDSKSADSKSSDSKSSSSKSSDSSGSAEKAKSASTSSD